MWPTICVVVARGCQVAELRAHLEASLGAEAAENRKRVCVIVAVPDLRGAGGTLPRSLPRLPQLEAMCAAMEDFAEASANKAAALEHKFDTALKVCSGMHVLTPLPH